MKQNLIWGNDGETQMFIQTQDRKHVINLDHVRRINVRGCNIEYEFSDGTGGTFGGYNDFYDTEKELTYLTNAIIDDERWFCMSIARPKQ